MIMFLLKKWVSPFLFPLSLGLELILIGLLLVWFTPKQRSGRTWVSIGFLFLTLISYEAFSERLLTPLESQYPAVINIGGTPLIKWVVVLGGGHHEDFRLPANEQLDFASLARLVEGIRLHRLHPQSRLLLSGGAGWGRVPEAELLAATASSLGVGPGDIRVESLSRDTEEQALFIREIVREDPFLLVTSSAHLPRSVALFEKGGMHPLPAPAHFLTKEDHSLRPGSFFPSAKALLQAQAAAHEYVGWMWSKIRNRI